jgi:hypothetical protein
VDLPFVTPYIVVGCITHKSGVWSFGEEGPNAAIEEGAKMRTLYLFATSKAL